MDSAKNIPGYCGFIPFKNHLVGTTCGAGNRVAQDTYRQLMTPSESYGGLSQSGAQIVSKSLYSPGGPIGKSLGEKAQSGIMVGNLSRYSETWINGPLHNIREQRIPGYTGFIPGIKSENIFSQTYTKNTAKSMASRIVRGSDQYPKNKFKSMFQKKFNAKHNRRLLEEPQEENFKDYLEYSMSCNKELKHGVRDLISHSPSYSRKGKYFDTSKATFTPSEYKRDLNGSPMNYQSKDVAVKPCVLERGLARNKQFAKLSDGFKRIFTEDDHDRGLKIAIVGYTGHRKGEKSENMFAKNFREHSFEAVRNQRIAKSTTKSYYIRS